MKQVLSLLLMSVLVVTLAACGNTGSTESSGAPTDSVPASAVEEENESSSVDVNAEGNDMVQSAAESETEQMAEDVGEQEETGTRILVAYFSRTGENYSVGYIEKGNTHIVADMIAEQTGGDTFEISTVTPYPDDYDECTEIAQQELNANARPELAQSLDNLDDYDVIFLGYPIWWGDMPMAVYTFLESNDFAGKTIIPFCTHEGSGLSSTESHIVAACPDAEVLDGLSLRGSVAQNSQEEATEAVVDWLRLAGFLE